MSILGLVVEYNPFHNGHLYHFNTSKEITQAEYSVCVMSGNFVQRGEPAIVDKWARTRMALNAGIDLVIELPVIYCVQSAEIFAYGAISILNKLGIIDTICFGTECNSLNTLINLGHILAEEPQEFKKYIKQYINEGISFASARSKALVKYITKNGCSNFEEHEIHNLLSSSNNILGLEYIKWLYRLKSNIKPLTIKRVNSRYNDVSLDTPMSSATAIRKALLDFTPKELSSYIPSFTIDIMEEAFNSGRGPIFIEDFSQAILCILRNMSANELSDIIDVNEGLEYKIKNVSTTSGSVEQLIKNIKSKRYTDSRIRRILIHSLLGLGKNDLIQFNNAGGPQYIRVLGFSKKGRKLLSMMKSTCNVPIITNVSDYKKYDNVLLKKMIEFDILSTDIYVTSYKDSNLRIGGLDYYKKPEII